jgi:hypothetical protein
MKDVPMRNHHRLTKATALLLGLALAAAACASDDDVAAEAEASAAVADDDAMEEEAMDDGAMDDGAMEEETMDDDAMDDDAMEEEAMEDDAMSDERPIITIDFNGLEPLGATFEYELWTIVDGAPVSGGLFDIDSSGDVAISNGQVHLYGHEGATDVVISIEPANDTDAAPALAKPLGGVIADDGSFVLETTHPATLGTDFADAAGQFILGTPSDGPDNNELSGLWFLQVPGPQASLSLPELPEGWVYEGWAVVDGNPISTGRFNDGGAPDDFSGFSGAEGVPGYPGEDFLVNAPDGFRFPVDLSGATAVISVEPAEDNSPAPFALKPLVGEIPVDPEPFTNYGLEAGPPPFSATGSQA